MKSAAKSPHILIEGLSGMFRTRDGSEVPVLHDVSFVVPRAGVTAVVGETGSGKSLTALSVLGLNSHGFKRTAGRIVVDGKDISAWTDKQMQSVRGQLLGTVFQDAKASLNPVMTIGRQLEDAARLGVKIGRAEARRLAVASLKSVQVTEPEQRMRQYAHQISGGMAQRVALALALVRRPSCLILDEPTTGLDVTIQSEIIDLVAKLTAEENLTTYLITHDLGVVAKIASNVVVMHSGRVLEQTTTKEFFENPQHEYSARLIAASRLGEERTR
ncbi:ABC transporter ATP-binding protein [Paenarthrobacter ureafaciens]|uniref:ABC transporter ATP-binding protein n=1 Tax=Paenarthrobacter ureafaciens TaxID=37931 RepID=UPI002DB9BAC8|nr:ABC transporter ATP-binding protein [Paenarthrobacter ureafaciens]MEC3853677.1 ABC transporter ATP-binding protein [Paenarthrobacter ureafaciens]